MNADAVTKTNLQPAWQPLSPVERRVLGVLIEKAKTTPDAYPLSLNAIRTGCNQKNNRSPVMDLDEDAVQEAVDALRQYGAMIEVQGGGRVPRYRHMGYEWLGVDKREIAVMAELLLRGAQTVGELRSHVARMEELPDLSALQPLLESLQAKQLLVAITPEGRGQVVSHTLYPPEELARVQRDYGSSAPASREAEVRPVQAAPATTASSSPRTAASAVTSPGRVSAATAVKPAPSEADIQQLAKLREELTETKARVSQLRDEFESQMNAIQEQIDELLKFKREIGG
jgi:uncharacterized protein YceH (UPF0502 family)